MIEIQGWLVSVTAGSRVAQVSVEGRGLARIPLTIEQERELAACVGKPIKVTLQETEAAGVEAAS